MAPIQLFPYPGTGLWQVYTQFGIIHVNVSLRPLGRLAYIDWRAKGLGQVSNLNDESLDDYVIERLRERERDR